MSPASSAAARAAGCARAKVGIEILGAGRFIPTCWQAAGIDPEVYSGFAFGMGIERVAMRRYNINDMRLFFENDVRFLSQF